jgi:myosin heavy subunit
MTYVNPENPSKTWRDMYDGCLLDLDSAKKVISDLKENAKGAVAFIDFSGTSYGDEISSLKSQLEGAFGLANLRHDDLDKFHTAIHHRDRSLDDIGVHGWVRTSTENLRAEFAAKDAEIASLKKAVDNKTDIEKMLDQQITLRDARLAEQDRRISELKSAGEILVKALEHDEVSSSETDAEIEAKDAEIAALKHDVSMLTADVERLRRLRESDANKAPELTGKSHSKRNISWSRQNEIDALKSELDQVRSRRDEIEVAYLRLCGAVNLTVINSKRNVGFGG